MDHQSLNGITMIAGSLLAITVALFGSRFWRILETILCAIALGLLAVGILTLATRWEAFRLVFQQTGLSPVWRLSIDRISWLDSLAQAGVLILGITLGILLYLRIPRTMRFFTNLVLYTTLTTVCCLSTGWLSPLRYPMIPIFVCALAGAICYQVWPTVSLAIETALIGGLSASFLFSHFYYLSLWVSIVLAVLLCGGGLTIQLASIHNRKHRDAVFSGKEPT
jgi:MFS family permease